MKTFSRFLIGIVVILAFIITILTSIFKFKVLDKDFWIATLNTPGTYQNIQTAVVAGFEQNAIKEGGSKSQTKNITKLVTVEFIKDVSERNIANIFDYLNGKNEGIVVYFPAKKLGFITVFPEEIDAKMLAAAFTGPNKDSATMIDSFKNTGNNATFAFVVSVLVLAIFVGLHMFLTPPTNRFKPTGRLFISSAIIIFLVTVFIELFVFKSHMLPELMKGEAIQILLGALLPPVTTQILLFIRYICAGLFVLGILLLVIKLKSANPAKKNKQSIK